MKIIALSGFKQSGKDTSADYLVKNHDFTKFSFASALKDMVSEQYDIPRCYCDDSKWKEQPLKQYPVDPKDPFSEMICDYMIKEFANVQYEPERYDVDFWTPRSLCILEGSVKRSVNSGYWVQRIIKDIQIKDAKASALYIIKEEEYKGGYYVISDLRYRSEIEQLKQEFGIDLITIRLDRFDSIDSNDPSEHDLDNYKFDYVIKNREFKEELYKKLEGIIKCI